MELIIDAGNTAIKVALFNNNEIIFQKRFTHNTFFNEEIELPADFTISKAIICNVSHLDTKEIIKKFHIVNIVEFTHNTSIPITNGYGNPEQLGLDRLAAAIGAEYILPSTNKLIIDLGTAITIDFVSESKIFKGGNITLGMQGRFKALNEYTGHLPLVSSLEKISLFGTNTTQAIQNGVIAGICYEIDGYINTYKSVYNTLTTFLTGGDCLFFEKNIKNSIFAQPNLVIIGLYSILKYNEKKINL